MTQAALRIAAALTHRNFRLLWFGALTSSIGTWMQRVAQAWLIVTMTGASSAFYLGLDSFVGEVPILLFTLIGGVVADRRDRRHMMLLSQVIQMAVALLLALLVFTGWIQIWMILTLSFIAGCAQALDARPLGDVGALHARAHVDVRGVDQCARNELPAVETLAVARERDFVCRAAVDIVEHYLRQAGLC